MAAVPLGLLIGLSVLFLAPSGVAAALAAAPVPAPAPSPQIAAADDDDDQRIKVPTWRLERIAVEGGDLRGLKPADMKAAVEAEVEKISAPETQAGDSAEARAARSKEEVDACKKVFEQYSFEQIEHMIKEVGLADNMKQILAEARRQMSRDAMEAVREKLKSIDPDGAVKIGMLDSGNKGSGIASDIDQTVFVFPRDLAEKLGITVEEVIKMFDAEFTRLHGMDPMRLGIESMNGWDFFPDWRAQSRMSSHESEARRVVREKRLNPEAYRSEGQLKSQAEGRGWDSLDDWGRNVEAFDNKLAELMTKQQVLRGKGDQAGADRLQGEIEKVRADYEAEARLSPWTEVGLDKNGRATARTDADPRGKVLPNRPEMAERFSFDGAYDNWIMYEHHPHNRPKYLLRSGAEGTGVKRTSVHNSDPNKRIVAFDYDVEYGRGNRELCRKYIDEIYKHIRSTGGGEGLSHEKIRMAFDAAAKFRLKHKGEAKGDGKPYTAEDIWKEYLPERPPGYYDHPQDGKYRKTIDIQGAQSRWDLVGREIMIENMILTVTDPLKVVTGGITDPEWARIKQQYPDANPEIWRRTAWLQLYHGVHDLLSDQHVRQLVGADDPNAPRRKDIVDRLLEKVTDPRQRAELERAVLDAARAKYALDPRIGLEKTFREAVWFEVRNGVVARFENTKTYAKSVYDEYKAGRYTQEVVAGKVMEGMAGRLGGVGAEVLGTLGLRGKIHLLMPNADFKLPALQIEFGKPAFSGKALMSRVLSSGNLDSALLILEAAIDNPNDYKAIGWVAAREFVMNFPYVAPGYALYDLVANGRPEGAVMMGSAMFIPGVGQAFIAVNIANTSVRIAGKLLLDPLKDDTKDNIYQGYLGAENQFRRDQGSKRVSLLDNVDIRVIPYTRKGPDGNVLERKDGGPQVFFATGPYSDDEAWDLELVESTEQLAFAREAGLLGGGPDWDEHLPRALDEIRDENLRFRFEAQRNSMFLHYWPKFAAFLATKGMAGYTMADLVVLEGHNGTQRLLLEFFRPYVDMWITGTGDFFNRGIGAENEVLIDTVAPPDRVAERERFLNSLAGRMVGDFFLGWQLVRGTDPEFDSKGKLLSPGSLESSMKLEIAMQWEKFMKYLSRQAAVAMEDARKVAPNPLLANAIHAAIKARAPTDPAPRIHVRPRVREASAGAVGAGAAGAGGDGVGGAAAGIAGDKDVIIDFLVSVVANDDPEIGFPGPYRIEVEWADIPEEPEVGETDRVELRVKKVTVFASNDKEVGFVEDIDIGTLSKSAEFEEPESMEGAFAVAPEKSGVSGLTATDAHTGVDFDAEPLFTYDEVWLFVTPERPLGQDWDWALLDDADETVAYGAPLALPAPDDENPPTEPNPSAAGEGAPGLYALKFSVEDTESGIYRFVTRDHWTPPALFGLGGPEEPYPWVDSGHTVELKEARLHFNGFVTESVSNASVELSGVLNARLTADAPQVQGTSVSWTGRAMWNDLEYEKDAQGDFVEVAGERRTAASNLSLEFPAELELTTGFDIEEMGQITYDLSIVDETGGVAFLAGVNSMMPSGTRPPSRSTASKGTWLSRFKNLDVPGGLDYYGTSAAESGNFQTVTASGRMQMGRPDHGETGVPKLELAWHLRNPDTIFVVPVYLKFIGEPMYGYGIYSAVPGIYDGPSPTDGPGGDGSGGAGGGAGGDTAGAGGDGTGNGDGSGGRTLDPASINPNDPDISGYIREWIGVAEPPLNATIGANLRYTEWGVMVGTVPGGVITANRPPDASAGWTSVEYVWMLRDDLDSVNHCKLGEYVMSKIGGPVLQCAGRYGPQPPNPLDDYRGRRMGRAKQDALMKGLAVSTVGGDPAPEPDLAFRVQDQWPAPETEVEAGAAFELKVYGDYVAVTSVPDLAGQSLSGVRERLGGAGLEFDVVGGDPAADESQAFTVQWQDPAAGAEVDPDSRVTVALFGAAPSLVRVPLVSFQTASDARAAIEGVGLVATIVGGDPAPWAEAAYRVQDQQPAASVEVEPGSVVEVVLYGAFEPTVAAIPPEVDDPPPAVTPPAPVGEPDPEPVWQPDPPAPDPPAPTPTPTPTPPPVVETTPTHAPFYVGGILQLPELPNEDDLPDELPEGTKPSAAIRALGYQAVKWERSETSPLLLRIEGEATAIYPPDMFTPGSKIAIPIRLNGSNPESGAPVAVAGSLLLEVTFQGTSMASLKQAFPDKAEELNDPASSVFFFRNPDGRMHQKMEKENENESVEVHAGPMERGWSEQSKAQAFEFFVQVLEAMDCFVATAVYGRAESPQLTVLRRFRDEVLRESPAGSRLVDAYYMWGPRVAARVRGRTDTRALLAPVFDGLVGVLERLDWDDPLLRRTIDAAAECASPWLPPNRIDADLLHRFNPFDHSSPLLLGGTRAEGNPSP